MSTLVLTALFAMLSGCDKQAKSDTQELKTTPKASVAGDAKAGCANKVADTKCAKSKEKKGWYAKKEKAVADANAPACKAAVKKECKAKKKCSAEMAKKCAADPNMMKNCPMKDKKGCHAKAEKKCSAEMAKKCAADPNMMKNCPMKDKKGCPMMKDKKACPKNCKKPCCAKKDAKCKVSDANAPAKQ